MTAIARGKTAKGVTENQADRKPVFERTDVVCVVALALLSVLIWCYIYNKFSAESWRTPITYLADIEKGDIIGVFADIKMAGDGHSLPLFSSLIPELGAPYVGNWNDYPTTEKPLLCFAGLCARWMGLFAGTNFTFMVEYVLASMAFYVACRLFGGNRLPSFAGALLFAFARFGIAQSEHHITVTYYWHLPLCLLVCNWIIRDQEVGFGRKRLWFAYAVAFIAGIQNVYYTNIFCQFVLFGGLLQWWRKRDWRVTLPALSVIGVSAVGFLLMNANTFIYHFIHGPNNGAVVRAYKWLEIYALKIVDMIVPPPDHHIPLFARFGAWHFSNSILPGEVPPPCYLGLVALAVMAWLLVISLKKAANNEKLPLQAYQILWILLYAEVGGLNCFVGSFGFQLFRATTRYSIVILCIILMYGVERFSKMKTRTTAVGYAVAIALIFIGLWDQTPPQLSDEELAETAAAVASDRNFTEKMEARLPKNAMVFQIPIMDFPESPAPGVGAYDHFRPYLYSHHLRYSFGSDKGRPRENWIHEFANMSLSQVVDRLESFGFAAMYVNKNGFPDKGRGIEKAFKDIGRGDMIVSDKDDLLCVFLKPSSTPMLPDGGLYR